MLTRLLVENYRTLEHVELILHPKHLLMGRNGTGKSSVFDVLDSLRRMVIEGEKCEDVFPLTTLPRWLYETATHKLTQRFVVEAVGPLGTLEYTLTIEHDKPNAQSRVFSEQLCEGEKVLFSFSDGKVQLYKDSGGAGPEYKFDWSRSAMATVPPDPANTKMTWLKERVRNVYCIRVDAPRMSARSEREESTPARDLSNFAAWYEYALKTDPMANGELLRSMAGVVSGFESLKFRTLGQSVSVLEARFTRKPEPNGLPGAKPMKPYVLDFSELSDGQRTLIGLHTVLHFLVREDTTVCIDEPDNFVALAEIQPLLLNLLDKADEQNAQVFLASHHPEPLNLLAVEHGLVLRRSPSGATVAEPFQAPPDTILTPAEYFAQGWDNA